MATAAADGARDTGDGFPEAPLRAPGKVSDLHRLGCLYPTRLSFSRTLVRRMMREGWRIRCRRFELDGRGVGSALLL